VRIREDGGGVVVRKEVAILTEGMLRKAKSAQK
jgi:hypothetical protein